MIYDLGDEWSDGRDVGAQVVCFIFLMTSSASSCVTSEKEQIGSTDSEDGSAVLGGRIAVAEGCVNFNMAL